LRVASLPLRSGSHQHNQNKIQSFIEYFIDKPLTDLIIIYEYCLGSPAEASVYFSLSFVHSGADDLSCLNDNESLIID